MRAVQSNAIPENGLVGRESNNNKFAPETLDNLCSFLWKSKHSVMSFQRTLLGTKHQN
jgi:hypothetical protein